VALRPKAIVHVTDRGGGSGFDWGRRIRRRRLGGRDRARRRWSS